MNIHIGWIGSTPPQRAHDAVSRAVAICPQCNVALHTDESMIQGNRRRQMDARGITQHQRSDIQRHAILEEHGGLWLDIDVRLLRSPMEWASGWNRYTAVFLRGDRGIIGTDIIYVPQGWPGWLAINERIDATLAGDRKPGILDFAHVMIAGVARAEPDLFELVPSGAQYPYGSRQFTADSVVCRGFDPPAVVPKSRQQRPRPGLGDLVAAGLDAVGITKARVQAVANRVGIKDCGCKARQERLNAAGRRLGIG